jgi:hypothetical protein
MPKIPKMTECGRGMLGRTETSRLAGLCACSGWQYLIGKTRSPPSSSAPRIRLRPTNGQGASGRGSCGTRRRTSRIPSRWIGSSAGRAASTPALPGSLGRWGAVRQRGPKESRPVGMVFNFRGLGAQERGWASLCRAESAIVAKNADPVFGLAKSASCWPTFGSAGSSPEYATSRMDGPWAACPSPEAPACSTGGDHLVPCKSGFLPGAELPLTFRGFGAGERGRGESLSPGIGWCRQKCQRSGIASAKPGATTRADRLTSTP